MQACLVVDTGSHARVIANSGRVRRDIEDVAQA
jgi:hypothetical protein